MPPAMVDFKSPLQNPNPNPRKGQSSSSSSSSSFIFNLPQQTLNSPMNSNDGNFRNFYRNANLPNLETASFAASSPAMASASGLSRPRLVKERRHFGSNRGKAVSGSASSGSNKETGLDFSFNPFRSGAPVSAGSDRTDEGKMRMPESGVDFGLNPVRSGASGVDGSDWGNESRVDSGFNSFRAGRMENDKMPVMESVIDSGLNPFRPFSSVMDSVNRTNNGGMGVLRDKLNSWNPFLQENKGRDGSSGSNTEKFEFGKLGDSGFVFGGGQMPTSVQSGSNSNSEAKSSLPDELRKLKIGNVMGPQNKSDAGVKTAEDNASLNMKSGEDCKQGVFVFGSSVKKSSTSAPNFPDGRSAAELPNEMRNLKIESEMAFQDKNNAGFTFSADRGATMTSDSNSGEVPGTRAFVFGTGGNKVSDSAPSLADESSASNLPDEIRKLKIRGSRKDRVNEKVIDTDFTSKADLKFGFVFGTGSMNVSGSFGEFAETTLPGEINKLSIKSQAGGYDETDTSFSSSTTSAKDTSFSSSTTSAKDTQFQNPANNRTFTDPTIGSSNPSPFTFQAGMKGNSSGVHLVPPTEQNEDFSSRGIAGPSSLSSSMGPGFQSGSSIFEQPPACPTQDKPVSSFSSAQEEFGTPHKDFRTPRQDTSSCSFRESLFGHQNVEFSAKQGTFKEMKPKKRRGKLGRKNAENKSQVNPELGSPRSYSPMDFSPYQETLTGDQCSRETSAASGESIPLESSNTHEAVPMDVRDDLLAPAQPLNVNDVDLKHGELNEEGSKHHADGDLGSEGLPSENENAECKNDGNIAAMGTEAGLSSSTVERQACDAEMLFHFASSSEGVGETNFTFAATPSSQRPSSVAKRHYRKKNLMKVTQDSYTSTPNVKVQSVSPSVQFMPHPTGSLQQELNQGRVCSSTSQLDLGQSLRGDSFAFQNEANKEPVSKRDSMPTAAATASAQEACEKWRQRGNHAYANGDLSKAEDYYTRGVNCVSPKETSRTCIRALMLCYSNRAATLMSLGRLREALGDCMMAAAIEPTFLRAQVRAANCYLALGEIVDALRHFKNCLQTACDVSLDQKIRTEAVDGLQKAQKVAECMDRSAELLQNRTYSDAANALEIITEALLISPYSENLIEMKAEALLMLRKYEEVVQLCEQTLESAERNSLSKDKDGSVMSYPVNHWRWGLVSKSYFYLGRLEEALELLEKLEQLGPKKEKYGGKVLESPAGFATIVRDLLRHKAEGNEAFQAGRHSEAVEHYTAALQCYVESRPFAAICFANRAAAYQALGQITDAIADCSLAIALDSNYPKAISRRATLHEMIRDYGQAINDLHRFISLLEKQTDDKLSQSGRSGRSTTSVNDIRQARMRLATMEEESKKDIPLDMYLILGIEPSSTAADIKKAYRKAALRHHPDKAGQLLPRSENGDDGLWKEVADEVHKDADRLFKMIGEAYAVISDPTKRLRYDAEEEIRNSQKKGNGSSAPKAQGDVYSYPFERTSSRRHWKSYGNSRRQWYESY
eukprot:TRINITY_DN6257_c0_g1_i6.p1 TRINITY_DN6257_c0_g1~~TRINITY_DN6257_c0_g1_i6.p1  ORF type:complete len:1510 (+),score=360.16 TRINITY_DN6257_c0_g1_i6:258-4787(+)